MGGILGVDEGVGTEKLSLECPHQIECHHHQQAPLVFLVRVSPVHLLVILHSNVHRMMFDQEKPHDREMEREREREHFRNGLVSSH